MKKIISHPGITILVLCLATWLIGSIFHLPAVFIKYLSIFAAVILLSAVLILSAKYKKDNRFELIAYIIIIAGFIIRALYILAVPYDVSLHDLGAFPPDGSSDVYPGHLGYIAYLYTNRHLPDFDPRTQWSFYNPPGFHIVSAAWYGFNRFIGFSQEVSLENLQILTLIFSTGIVMALYKIMLEFFPRNNTLLLLLSLVSFFPFITIMSGTVNNDCLAALLGMISILYTIRWHKSHRIKDICIIASAFGLGMFTKLNNAVLAIPVGFIFVYDFIKDIKNFKKYLLQFILFLVICAPPALFWSIRNAVLYDMPVNYVQQISDTSPQSIRYIEKIRYIGLPTRAALTYPFITPNPETDHNIWLQLVKTSLFDELRIKSEFTAAITFSRVFLWFGIAMWMMSVVSYICILFKKKTLNPEMKFFFGILFLSQAVSIVSFTFSYPFVCTMNFRYVMPLMLLPCISLCSLLNCFSRRNMAKNIIQCFLAYFAGFSVFFNVLMIIL